MTGHLLGRGDSHARADDERYREACADDAPACFPAYYSDGTRCGRCGNDWPPAGCKVTIHDIKAVAWPCGKHP